MIHENRVSSDATGTVPYRTVPYCIGMFVRHAPQVPQQVHCDWVPRGRARPPGHALLCQ